MTVRSFMTLLIMLTMTMVVNAKSTNAMSGAVTSAPVEDVYILGEINGKGWVTNDGVKMTRGEDGIYTATISTDKNGKNYFCLTKKLSETENDWDTVNANRFGAFANGGNEMDNFAITSELLGEEITLSYEGYNMAFEINEGVYTLTLDLNKMTLVAKRLDEVFILGQVNENDWATNVGLPMTRGEDGLYTATIIADGRVEGANYFSFTHKLSDNPDDWEAIDMYRFGAQSDGDFWVTDDLLGEELSIIFKGRQALRVPKGEYTLTLDLDNLKLVITAAPSISTKIDQVSSDKSQITSGEWFTIDGRKLSGKPAKKGVYIHNGKKAVVR